MTPQQKTLLSLIRAIVRGAYDAPMMTGVDWETVRAEATRQGVQGLCFDALELLPADGRPDKKVLLEWLGQVAWAERLYEKHKLAIDALSLICGDLGRLRTDEEVRTLHLIILFFKTKRIRERYIDATTKLMSDRIIIMIINGTT